MRHTKTFLQWGLTIALLCFMVACGPDDDNTCCDPTNPECPNYDPCYGKEEPNASFFTEDRLIYPEFGEYLWINDSILRGGPVRFRSPFEGDGIAHKWYIGAEIIEESSVVRNFSQVQRPEYITVSHVITYPVDSLCYPAATGRDSIAQTFYLVDFLSELLTIDNTFRGVLNNETDSFDFKFRALQTFTGEPAQTSTSGYTIFMINFHNNQDSIVNDSWGMTNTHLYLYGAYGPVKGLMSIDPEDLSVEMNYHFVNDETEYRFRGRVIPE